MAVPGGLQTEEGASRFKKIKTLEHGCQGWVDDLFMQTTFPGTTLISFMLGRGQERKRKGVPVVI